jgi:hypothetical protein
MVEETPKAPISGGNFLANALGSRRGDRSTKVSAQLKANKPAPQVVNNNQ